LSPGRDDSHFSILSRLARGGGGPPTVLSSEYWELFLAPKEPEENTQERDQQQVRKLRMMGLGKTGSEKLLASQPTGKLNVMNCIQGHLVGNSTSACLYSLFECCD
jgi:hypothetical protein